MRLFLSVIVGLGYHSFLETILSTMGFISHNDNISSFRERAFAFLEFLHGGEDDSVCLSTFEQFLQMVTVFRMQRSLTKEVLALGELTE